MNISILTSRKHPINDWLQEWVKKNNTAHSVAIFYDREQLIGGDILFLISFSEILSREAREKFKVTLVIHASDLPKGRGWSPHIWEIINGASHVVLTLLEAGDEVDSGNIWNKTRVEIPVTALYDEINQLIFQSELELMDFAVEKFDQVQPQKQDTTQEVTYWPRRRPENSELDITKTIDEQFDQIRVCDPYRFPAFFYKNGRKFYITLTAADNE
ncbi:formyltransferase family protein [Methylophaga nitratireducenticrescens]|uniref:formyltransferase family protein n=1 Tax=Methylophaga nitratireducenticrescens TaxID=754476 RepID=UPI000CDBC2A8|nr:formyltransferase family protein [Methylophaga nitratireducenticrescens]AUZ84045.1 UDP-glucuronic acid dehydrogenase [Methylophaga nitratireducenticrescens]